MLSSDTVINQYYELLNQEPNETNLKALIAYSQKVADQYHSAQMGKTVDFQVSDDAAAVFNAIELLTLNYQKAIGDYVPVRAFYGKEGGGNKVGHVAFETFRPQIIPGLEIIRESIKRAEFNLESLSELQKCISGNENLAQKLKKADKRKIALVN
jgi:hypothetical protein